MSNPVTVYRAVEAARAAHRRGVELLTAARAAAVLHGLDTITVQELVRKAELACHKARQEQSE